MAKKKKNHFHKIHNHAVLKINSSVQVKKLKTKNGISCISIGGNKRYYFEGTDTDRYIQECNRKGELPQLVEFRHFIPYEIFPVNDPWNRQFCIRKPSDLKTAVSNQLSGPGFCMRGVHLNSFLKVIPNKSKRYAKGFKVKVNRHELFDKTRPLIKKSFIKSTFIPMIGFGDGKGTINSLVDFYIRSFYDDKIDKLDEDLSIWLNSDQADCTIDSGFENVDISGTCGKEASFNTEYFMTYFDGIRFTDNKNKLVAEI